MIHTVLADSPQSCRVNPLPCRGAPASPTHRPVRAPPGAYSISVAFRVPKCSATSSDTRPSAWNADSGRTPGIVSWAVLPGEVGSSTTGCPTCAVPSRMVSTMFGEAYVPRPRLKTETQTGPQPSVAADAAGGAAVTAPAPSATPAQPSASVRVRDTGGPSGRWSLTDGGRPTRRLAPVRTLASAQVRSSAEGSIRATRGRAATSVATGTAGDPPGD